jgi:ATP-dependent DNA ligase
MAVRSIGRLEMRKTALSKLVRPQYPGIRMLDHLEFDDGQMIFEHACELGCEGIVSKRLSNLRR